MATVDQQQVIMSKQESVVVPEKRWIVFHKRESWSRDTLGHMEPEEEAEEVVGLNAECWYRILMAAVYLFFVSLLTWSLGLVTFLHADDGDAARYYPGIIVSCGAFLGVVGVQVIVSSCPRDAPAGRADNEQTV